MSEGPESLIAVVEGPSGEERQIKLVRQDDGRYEEVDEIQETLIASVEGRFGKEYKITLVRQPDGQYKEMIDPCLCMVR